MTMYRVFIEERRVQIINVEAPDAAAACAEAERRLRLTIMDSQAYQRTVHVTEEGQEELLTEQEAGNG